MSSGDDQPFFCKLRRKNASHIRAQPYLIWGGLIWAPPRSRSPDPRVEERRLPIIWGGFARLSDVPAAARKVELGDQATCCRVQVHASVFKNHAHPNS